MPHAHDSVMGTMTEHISDMLHTLPFLPPPPPPPVLHLGDEQSDLVCLSNFRSYPCAIMSL